MTFWINSCKFKGFEIKMILQNIFQHIVQCFAPYLLGAATRRPFDVFIKMLLVYISLCIFVIPLTVFLPLLIDYLLPPSRWKFQVYLAGVYQFWLHSLIYLSYPFSKCCKTKTSQRKENYQLLVLIPQHYCFW